MTQVKKMTRVKKMTLSPIFGRRKKLIDFQQQKQLCYDLKHAFIY